MSEVQPYKTFDSLKSHIKSIPCESIAERLGLDLIRTGNNLQGDCPTGHTSKGGKCFSINTVDNYGHCFSCGRSFDNISLVQVKLGLNFPEAIKWIAESFGVKYSISLTGLTPRIITPEEEEELKKFHINALLYESAFIWMHNLLFDEVGEEALRYLTAERNYDPEVLKNSEFCYFPESTFIQGYLQKLHIGADNEIVQLPLNGHFRDNFRLAIPYRNAQGQITGFLKRATRPEGITIQDKDGKVTENVRWDSTYGLKKKDIFNLSKCKGQETLLIVEGYPDAVYFTALGVPNVVAVGQGLLSKSHLDGMKINRIKNVIISFDKDEVGPKNTEAAVRLILEDSDIIPFVLEPSLLAPHKDPDEYYRANGLDAFKTLLKKVVKGLYWCAENKIKNLDKSDSLEKEKIKDELLELTKYATDPTDVTFLVDFICKNLGFAKADIKTLVKIKQEELRIASLKKMKEKGVNKERYFPFIEKSTSSYSYWDTKDNSVHLGIPREILENILISEEISIPEIFQVLRADFDVHYNDRIDAGRELFNLFVPSKFMLLKKTDVRINLRKEFPHIYKLLSNLFPVYRERKLFINWLAGILQTREKQLTAWVLKGKPGAGKGVLLHNVLKPLFGERQVMQVEDEQLNSQFNPWLQNAILIAFNEVAHDNNTRNSIKSKIKAIITDSEIMINEKNIKNFLITNFVNCLFYSNEGIPVFIEEGDRRFNVVSTGVNLRSHSWFSNNPEAFIAALGDEVGSFAKFLMNWNYDPIAAKTCINNEEKKILVGASMNRFEEFATHLKKEDADWFDENISQSEFYGQQIRVIASDLGGRIKKSLALNAFNSIYSTQKVNDVQLGKQLKLYGIKPDKVTINGIRERVYTWFTGTIGRVSGLVESRDLFVN